MNVPGYTADASLYRSAHMYRPSNAAELAEAATAVSGLVLAQLKGGACIAGCIGVEIVCATACAWAGPVGGIICEIGCGAQLADCVANCPPDPTGGGGGNGGGPPPAPMCCPPWHKCCGKCVNLPTGGQRCDGQCIGPTEVCP
jgi:hypothetical protein